MMKLNREIQSLTSHITFSSYTICSSNRLSVEVWRRAIASPRGDWSESREELLPLGGKGYCLWEAKGYCLWEAKGYCVWSRRLVRSEKIYTTLQNPKVLRIVLFSLSMIFWNVFEANYGKQRPKSQISKNGGLVKGKSNQTQAFYDCQIGEIWGDFAKNCRVQQILSAAGVNRWPPKSV